MQPTGRGADRREQILQTTLAVVAEVGYHAASFGRIVERARLSSSRLITYHFTTKDALMQEALAYVVQQATAFMQPRIQRARTSRTQLAAYIRSNLQFVDQNPVYAAAAVEIARNLPTTEDELSVGEAALDTLVRRFTAGQDAKEMRRFDARVMAASVRASIDMAVVQSVKGTIDLRRYAEELVAMFDRATRE